ncbi:MAG: adenosylmethionine--8-amino-7-oxononanoate transaminase [Bacteroidota bacterium]
MKNLDYTALDKELIWHPFTHLKYQKENIVITRAKGIYLYTQNNRKIIDGIGSWWVNVHGHSHPHIVKKIKQQLQSMEHCIFSGFTHPPAIELAHLLSKISPIKKSKIFYSDNGSTAVEVAIKMALQYFYNQDKPYRNKIIAFKNAYHGDTFGGMSVAERNVFNLPFKSNLFDTYFIDLPDANNFPIVKRQLIKYIDKDNVAAFIFEPLVQGAAGMKMYEAKYLDELISICKFNNVITIADEVFTGFGKTGKVFASDFLKNKPDIICLSKGLTGGFLPLGVTIAHQKIFNAFVSSDKTKTFYHGHSYTANPLMCAAAIGNLELIQQPDFLLKIKTIEQWHKKFVKKIEQHQKIKDIRCKGIILAIEIKTKDKTHYLNELSTKIEQYFLERDILLRPLGNVLYIVPPVIIKENEMQKIYSAIESFLDIV